VMGRRVSEYEKRFREFVEELCRSGLAKEVYLVGSRARGDNTPSSDFDVVLVVGDDKDPVDVATKARAIKKKAFSTRHSCYWAMRCSRPCLQGDAERCEEDLLRRREGSTNKKMVLIEFDLA